MVDGSFRVVREWPVYISLDIHGTKAPLLHVLVAFIEPRKCRGIFLQRYGFSFSELLLKRADRLHAEQRLQRGREKQMGGGGELHLIAKPEELRKGCLKQAFVKRALAKGFDWNCSCVFSSFLFFDAKFLVCTGYNQD